MARIQIITIVIDVLFLAYISWLIYKRKLREEYAILWILCSVMLIIFLSGEKAWMKRQNYLAYTIPPNFVFTAFIFIILIYLLHLSIVNSRLQKNVINLTQELALLKKLQEKRDEVPVAK